MFFLSRKKKEPRPEKNFRPRYIYKPGENAMAFRLEYRDDASYVYPGWGKHFLYKISGNCIFRAGEEEPSYIIIGKNICAPDSKPLWCVEGGLVYRAGEHRPSYELRDSITVQGTL